MHNDEYNAEIEPAPAHNLDLSEVCLLAARQTPLAAMGGGSCLTTVVWL